MTEDKAKGILLLSFLDCIPGTPPKLLVRRRRLCLRWLKRIHFARLHKVGNRWTRFRGWTQNYDQKFRLTVPIAAASNEQILPAKPD